MKMLLGTICPKRRIVRTIRYKLSLIYCLFFYFLHKIYIKNTLLKRAEQIFTQLSTPVTGAKQSHIPLGGLTQLRAMMKSMQNVSVLCFLFSLPTPSLLPFFSSTHLSSRDFPSSYPFSSTHWLHKWIIHQKASLPFSSPFHRQDKTACFALEYVARHKAVLKGQKVIFRLNSLP